MAGRAAPGSTVTVLDGERVVGKVKADENGEWVFVPDEALPPGERRLTLRVEDASGKAIGSEDTVVLIVPQAGKDIAGRPAGSGSQALALRLGPGGSQATVLQAPSSATEAPPVSIQAVDYGQGGSATVSGRAAPGATVQLYLDNTLAGRTQAGADGAWRIAIETPPDARAFGLRADEVSEQGQVTARVAVPFTRGAGGMEPGPAVTSIVVQQGPTSGASPAGRWAAASPTPPSTRRTRRRFWTRTSSIRGRCSRSHRRTRVGAGAIASAADEPKSRRAEASIMLRAGMRRITPWPIRPARLPQGNIVRP